MFSNPKSQANFLKKHKFGPATWKNSSRSFFNSLAGVKKFLLVVVVKVVSLNRLGGGGREWVTIYDHLLNPLPAKNYYVIESRDENDVTDKRTSLFVAHYTNRWPIPSNFACRHRDATMTSQQVFSCRNLDEYSSIEWFTEPKVTKRNGKQVNCGSSLPRECFWHHRSTTMVGKVRDLI